MSRHGKPKGTRRRKNSAAVSGARRNALLAASLAQDSPEATPRFQGGNLGGRRR